MAQRWSYQARQRNRAFKKPSIQVALGSKKPCPINAKRTKSPSSFQYLSQSFRIQGRKRVCIKLKEKNMPKVQKNHLKKPVPRFCSFGSRNDRVRCENENSKIDSDWNPKTFEKAWVRVDQTGIWKILRFFIEKVKNAPNKRVQDSQWRKILI